MAVTALRGVFSTPYAKNVSKHPEDMVLEVINDTVTNTGETYTMLTDTSEMGIVHMAIPVNRTTDPGEVSAVVQDPKKSVKVYSETNAEAHDIYLFGNYGYAGNYPAFILRHEGQSQHQYGIVWEMVRATLASGVLAVDVSADLQVIDMPLIVIPTQDLLGTAAAPDVNGVGVNTLSSDAFTLECGAGTDSVACLVGGLSLGAAPATYTIGAVEYEGKPIHLPNARDRAAGDLIGEIITKDLADGDGYSSATITASSDCQYIRNIEMIIPITNETTALAVAWLGDTGTTSGIVSADENTSNVTCLVLGY